MGHLSLRDGPWQKNIKNLSAPSVRRPTGKMPVCPITSPALLELDHQRSAAKTLVNKMGLDTFVLFNI